VGSPGQRAVKRVSGVVVVVVSNCQKCVHRKNCSDTKGSMFKVSKSFVCRGCTDQAARTNVDIYDNLSNKTPQLID